MLGSGTRRGWAISRGERGMAEWIERKEVKERGEEWEIDLASQEMTADEGLS